MRRTLTKGSYVKVKDPGSRYPENEDKAKELGSTDKLNKGSSKTGSTGDVIGADEGYVLVDFGDFENLYDIEGVEITKKPEEVKMLCRFMHNNALEEYSNEGEITARMEELIKNGSMRLDSEVKVYPLAGAPKSLKMKLNIFLE